jgi:hypothetical protein
MLGLEMSATTSAVEKGAGELWAITCYFNPVGWRRRLAN